MPERRDTDEFLREVAEEVREALPANKLPSADPAFRDAVADAIANQLKPEDAPLLPTDPAAKATDPGGPPPRREAFPTPPEEVPAIAAPALLSVPPAPQRDAEPAPAAAPPPIEAPKPRGYAEEPEGPRYTGEEPPTLPDPDNTELELEPVDGDTEIIDTDGNPLPAVPKHEEEAATPPSEVPTVPPAEIRTSNTNPFRSKWAIGGVFATGVVGLITCTGWNNFNRNAPAEPVPSALSAPETEPEPEEEIIYQAHFTYGCLKTIRRTGHVIDNSSEKILCTASDNSNCVLPREDLFPTLTTQINGKNYINWAEPWVQIAGFEAFSPTPLERCEKEENRGKKFTIPLVPESPNPSQE